MRPLPTGILIAASAALLCAPAADAAIYFRNKEVLRDGKMVADMERIYWTPVPDATDTDRIQGHLDINIDGREVSTIVLVFQVFDTKGNLIKSFSITPKTCGLHPSHWEAHDYCERTFPFCGVENSHMKISKSDGHLRCYENWKKSECCKKGNAAWFYVDFPRDRNAQSMRLVNVVINDKEVQYTVRFAANKLVRSNFKPPEIKHGTEAELGDEIECREWLPSTSGGNAAAQPDGGRATPLGNGNEGGAAARKTGGRDSAPVPGLSAGGRTDMSETPTSGAIIPEAPLRLDVSGLVALRSGFTGKAYKCKALLDEFTAAVGQANDEAECSRGELDRAVQANLGKLLEKAQSEGELDAALAIKMALDAFPDKLDAGGSAEVLKVFSARASRLAQINRDLARNAMSAAKTLNAALAEQKGVWTKKGELDVAKTIADFQRALSAWTKENIRLDNRRGASGDNGKEMAAPPRSTQLRRPGGGASSGASSMTLAGTQSEMSVTLANAATPHVVKGQYLVPAGRELIVEAGATIVFEKDASLYCEGTLTMNGTDKSPIVCRGEMPKAGYWNGITVKSRESVLDFVQITYAATGITTVNGPDVRNCVFAKNECGVNLGHGRGDQSFVNCSMSYNSRHGIDAGSGTTVSLDGCTIEKNGEWGIFSSYHYGTVKMESSKVSGNRAGGIHLRRGGSHAIARNCIIMDNNGVDVENACDDETRWDMRQNYWGASATGILRQRGDGANLPSIKDGRDAGRGNIVDIAEFLVEPPKNCGATVTL